MQKIILASESPRRRELLASLDIDFMTCSPQVEEVFDASLSIEKAVQKVALTKAGCGQKQYPNDLIIGADTIVVLDQQILGKPKDEDDAIKMITLLSGKTHTVYTGVALVYEEQYETFCEKTEVTFYELSEDMIHAYIATKEYKDKAGSYGIQGKGCVLVRKINGDYFNVVGLPLASLSQHLNKYNK